MKYTTENPRYTAYTTNVFGHDIAGDFNRRSDAWRAAINAAKDASIDRPGINHTAEIFDRAANDGRGGMVFRLKNY